MLELSEKETQGKATYDQSTPKATTPPVVLHNRTLVPHPRFSALTRTDVVTHEQCNGLQPCATCVSRNGTCAYIPPPADMSRARARYHHESSNPASYPSTTSQRTQANANALVPHTNECMPEDFNLSPIRPTSSSPRQGTATNDANASSAASILANLVPRPVEPTYQGRGPDQLGQIPNRNIVGRGSELPVDPATGSNGGYGRVAPGNSNGSHGSHGGREEEEQLNGDGNPKATSRGSSEGERLNEQSRLLNDGKGRLCKSRLGSSLAHC